MTLLHADAIRCRRTLPTVMLIAALASGCSKGGGGNPGPATIALVGAAFVGAAASPTNGDQLLLYTSENASLAPGQLLDDIDLALSAGTLGSVMSLPSLTSVRTIAITLGAGVTFTPGVTTIAITATNDALRDASGRLALVGSPVVISDGDGDPPSITQLTLNEIDDELNGTGTAGGTLQVPTTGFTIDIDHTDPTSPIDPSATTITASATVTTGGGPQSPGTDLSPFLSRTTVGNHSSFAVPPAVTFPTGAVTITATARDASGMLSAPAAFSFLVRTLDDAVRPFETGVNATQVWFLDTTRDVESYTHNTASTSNAVPVTAGANGTSDLEDLFAIVGMFGSQATVNATVRSQFEATLTNELDSLYSGANVTFTFTSPGTFPAGPASVGYANLGFSQICIAGAEGPTGDSGILGVAIFDTHNATQNDDCRLDFGGSQRLGVFVHTLVQSRINGAAVTLFRQTYDAFTPGRGGVPIGDAMDGLDPQRLAGTQVDARATAISLAISRMARFTAVVTAHETGHSMGLVEDGAMPNGLYGGDANFGGASGHISLSSFPAGAQNVMAAAIGFQPAINAATAFNDLNLAYLRERAVHN